MLLFTEFMLTFKIHLGRIELFISTYILIWPKVISEPTVLVSCGYCIKLLQVCWLKTTEIYSSLTVLEDRSPMSRCHGALLPLKTVGEILSLPLSASAGSALFRGLSLCYSSLCLHGHTASSSPASVLPLSFKTIRVIEFRSHLDYPS